MTIRTFEMSTKLNERSTAVKTAVTLDFANLSEEETHDVLEAWYRVRLASAWRADGVIPTAATIDAAEYAPGQRRARKPVDATTAAMALDEAGKLALMEKLRAELGL